MINEHSIKNINQNNFFSNLDCMELLFSSCQLMLKFNASIFALRSCVLLDYSIYVALKWFKESYEGDQEEIFSLVTLSLVQADVQIKNHESKTYHDSKAEIKNKNFEDSFHVKENHFKDFLNHQYFASKNSAKI